MTDHLSILYPIQFAYACQISQLHEKPQIHNFLLKKKQDMK